MTVPRAYFIELERRAGEPAPGGKRIDRFEVTVIAVTKDRALHTALRLADKYKPMAPAWSLVECRELIGFVAVNHCGMQFDTTGVSPP